MPNDKETKKKIMVSQSTSNTEGIQYVVRGAELMCPNGTKHCALDLLVDYGKYDSKQPVATVVDTNQDNISGFAGCTYLRGSCVPNLGDKWIEESNNLNLFVETEMKDEQILIADAYLPCYSGQANIEVIWPGQKNNKNSSEKLVEFVAKEDVNYMAEIEDEIMTCRVIFEPQRTGYYKFEFSFDTNIILAVVEKYYVIGFSTDINTIRYEKNSGSQMYCLRAGTKYAFSCILNTTGKDKFHYSVSGNIDVFSSASVGVSRWYAPYPDPKPVILGKENIGTDPKDWTNSILYMPRTEIDFMMRFFYNFNDYIYEKIQIKLEENNTFQKYVNGQLAVTTNDTAAAVMGTLVGLCAQFIGITSTVFFPTASALLIAAFLNSNSKKVDPIDIMLKIIMKCREITGYDLQKKTSGFTTGIVIKQTRSYFDLYSYKLTFFVTAWNEAEVLGEKYGNGDFMTNNTDDLANIFSDESIDLIDKELELGLMYLDKTPDFQDDIRARKNGIILRCSEMEVL